MEAKHYYAGLHTASTGPVLICRTSRGVWELPRGAEEYFRPKELKVVGNHDIQDVWEKGLAAEVHVALREKKINWSSTDIVRIGYADEHSGDVILWIGVRPDSSLSYEVAIDAALHCKSLVVARGILDVEVEMREADVFRHAGPQFLPPAFDLKSDPTAEVRMALASTLGMTICSRRTPWGEGSGGFYVTDGKRLLLVTARHVLFPPSTDDNKLFEYKSSSSGMPRKDVVLLSESSFKEYLVFIQKQIDGQDGIITVQQKKLVYWNAREGAPQAAKGLADAQIAIKEAEVTKKALVEFQRLVTKDWAPEKNRVIGHVVYSPPIVVGAGPNQFTQDVAVVEMDLSKISRRPNNFPGNAIDLGFEFDPTKLSEMMHAANIENVHSFDYPVDRLLHLSGVVADEEIRNPTMTDQDGNRCIVVLKKGRTTRLTVGRANNVVSYARTYFKDTDEEQISMELAIFPYDKNSGPFSAKGDSGSVIVNGAGELYGLLTGGSGITERTDITYATEIDFVMEVIRRCKFLANVYIGVPDQA